MVTLVGTLLPLAGANTGVATCGGCVGTPLPPPAVEIVTCDGDEPNVQAPSTDTEPSTGYVPGKPAAR